MVAMPIVYTIQGCDACVKLLDKWNTDGVEFEERRADLSQEIMEEARSFGRRCSHHTVSGRKGRGGF